MTTPTELVHSESIDIKETVDTPVKPTIILVRIIKVNILGISQHFGAEHFYVKLHKYFIINTSTNV